MTTRLFLAAMLIVFTAAANFNCASSKSYAKLQSVRIIDAGEVMSTYEMSEEDKAAVRVAAKNVNLDPEYVFKHAQESGWPNPLSDFNYRIEHPAEIQALKARIFADLGESYILIIPKKENKGSKFPFTQDVFMVFKKRGISAR
jgi:hypothetical protein